MKKKFNMLKKKNIVILLLILVITIILAKQLHKETYVINFITNGGTTVESIKVKEGIIPKMPENPSKEGYAFVGWQLNENDYKFDKPINSNITLTAKWIKAEYYIRINKVDDYSPDRYLTVYKEEKPIKVIKVKYLDDISLVCLIKGTQIVVTNADIVEETSLKVILEDGSEVVALLIK